MEGWNTEITFIYSFSTLQFQKVIHAPKSVFKFFNEFWLQFMCKSFCHIPFLHEFNRLFTTSGPKCIWNFSIWWTIFKQQNSVWNTFLETLWKKPPQFEIITQHMRTKVNTYKFEISFKTIWQKGNYLLRYNISKSMNSGSFYWPVAISLLLKVNL